MAHYCYRLKNKTSQCEHQSCAHIGNVYAEYKSKLRSAGKDKVEIEKAEAYLKSEMQWINREINEEIMKGI